jgi:hypothetical protein
MIRISQWLAWNTPAVVDDAICENPITQRNSMKLDIMMLNLFMLCFVYSYDKALCVGIFMADFAGIRLASQPNNMVTTTVITNPVALNAY